MSSKQVNSEQNAGSRRNMCRSLMPVRNNSIRGVSLNHSVNPLKATDTSQTTAHTKTMPKILTVSSLLCLVLCRKGK